MIELEKVDMQRGWAGGYGALWSSADQMYVISEEDGRFWVRDESGALGDFPTFDGALHHARLVWGVVELAPANRLRAIVESGHRDSGDHLLEYLAKYGAVGIDVQALANRVFELIEEDD